MLALNRNLGQTIGIALLAAAWASRAFHYAGQVYPEGATQAPAPAQVAALHDVLVGLVILLAIALGLAVWAFAQTRRPALSPDGGAETVRQEYANAPKLES
jgi:hypothetical protein